MIVTERKYETGLMQEGLRVGGAGVGKAGLVVRGVRTKELWVVKG